MGVQIALVGVSHPHGIPYLETLQSLPEVGGLHLWDEDGAAAESARREHPQKIVGLYKSLGELMESHGIQAALVALPPSGIPPVAERFLRGGKHVLVEKPGARMAAELAPLVGLAREKRLIFSVSYPLRCNPVAVAIKEQIDKGCLGQIVSFEGRWLASQVRFRDPSLWLFKKDIAGGGILSWLGCHWIDLLHFWLDDEVQAVSCQAANLSGENIDVEDTICMTLRFRGGSIGTMRLGYHLPVSRAGYVGGSYDTYLHVGGSEGFIRWIPKGELCDRYEIQSVHPGCRAQGLSSEIIPIAEKPGYSGYEGWAFLNSFIQAVGGGAAPPADGGEAVKTLKVINAAYLSNESGRTVLVEREVQNR